MSLGRVARAVVGLFTLAGCASPRVVPPPPLLDAPRPSVVRGPFVPPVVVSDQLGSRRGLTIRPPANPGPAMPLVVFLHADGGDHTDFVGDRLLQRFADDHGLMMMSVDSPGMGDSACWWTPFKRAQALYLETVIEAVAAAWPIDRSRVVLVGKSGGAFLAAGFPAYVDARFSGGVVGVCGGDVPRENTAVDWCAVDETQDDPPLVVAPGTFDAWSLYVVTTAGDPWRSHNVAAVALWRENGRPVALYEAGRGGHCALDAPRWMRRGIAWTLGLPE